MVSFLSNTENFRIWLPKKLQKRFKDRFLEISISKNGDKSVFISRINKDGRIVIPKQYRNAINIDRIDVLEVKIKKLNNPKRNENHFDGQAFDMLNFIPKNTLSGYPVLMKEEDDKIYVWYSAKGRPNGFTLNKHIPMDFARLLGYYQAEGTKQKLVKRRGRTFSFTNKNLKICQDFISLAGLLFDKRLLKASIRHNPLTTKGELDSVTQCLQLSGIQRASIKHKPSQKISKYTITIWISNSILAETVQNMMNITRCMIAMNDKIVCKSFLQGLIAGDGCFASYIDRKGSQHCKLQLFDANEKYVNDYKNLLAKFDIDGKIKKDSRRNMSAFTSYIGWDNLLNLNNLKLLQYTIHNEKLTTSIKNHKRYRSLKLLTNLPDKFYRNVNLSGKGRGYKNSWLRDRTVEGVLLRIDEKDKTFWIITNKGKYYRESVKGLG